MDQLITAQLAGYGENPEFGWMHGSYIGGANPRQAVDFMAYYNETQIIVGHIHDVDTTNINTWSSILASKHIKMCLITEDGTTVQGSAGNYFFNTGSLADHMDDNR